MAGHSKWANIQHRKKKQDAKRGKLFTKLIRVLTISARDGADPTGNPRLRDAIDKAKLANMSNDTIDKAIKRGAGGLDGANVEEIAYEGYGPGGVAVLVKCITDNRNRTVGEVRHAFTKCGGNLGTTGSVAYLFQKKGIISFMPDTDEDKVMTVALEALAEDVVMNDDASIDVLVAPEYFDQVKTAIEKNNLIYENAEVTLMPSTAVNLDQETAEKMLRLQDMLEDLDDVQEVYSNAEIDAEILKNLE